MNHSAHIQHPTEHPANLLADPCEATDPVQIAPKMAQLLEFTQKNQSTITPKEINTQLEQVLQNYDALTALYADNNARLDAELAQMRSTHTANTAHVHHDIGALDTRVDSIQGLLHAQDHILREQSDRLDQFGMAQALLDNATRGNRNRIEAVREWASNQHAITKAHIEGLRALQREHFSQFQSLQQAVGLVRAETQRLDKGLVQVTGALERHARDTRNRFQWTHGALVGLLLVGAAGFAAFKWSDAFTPVATERAVAQLDTRISDVHRQVNDLSTLQEVAIEQDAKTAQLAGTVAQLQRELHTVGQSVHTLRAAQTRAALDTSTGLPLHDNLWLQQQSPKAYTVQLLGTPNAADLARFVSHHAGELGNFDLAYARTQRKHADHYHLFYGVFASAAQARAAMDALAPALHTQQPWVRPLQSVQNALQ